MRLACNLSSATILCAASLFGASAAHAVGVPAGTLIENTAQATYESGGNTETVSSNTASFLVDEVLDVTVASIDAGPVDANGGDAVLAFSVTNTGNGPEAFALTANSAVAGNDFDALVDAIAIDSNGNGVYDPGVDEILTAPEQTPVLNPDEQITVFVVLAVPDTAADGDTAQVNLLAEAVTGTGTPGTSFDGQGEGGGDAIAGSGGAADNALGALEVGLVTVDLVKSASVVDPFGGSTIMPGAVVTYTISAEIAGTGTIADFVISDPIPADTTYVASSLILDGASLTDGADADEGTASDAAGISVDLGTVSGGTTRSITFDVTID